MYPVPIHNKNVPPGHSLSSIVSHLKYILEKIVAISIVRKQVLGQQDKTQNTQSHNYQWYSPQSLLWFIWIDNHYRANNPNRNWFPFTHCLTPIS